MQIDPLTDEMPDMSTYHYAYNDPIGNIDKDGLIGIGSILAQVACQNSGSILQGLTTFLGQAASAIGSVSSVTLSIISTTASITGQVGKQVDQNNRIGKQVGQPKPSLDGIKIGATQEDFDKKEELDLYNDFYKLRRKSWKSVGSNKMVNELTGEEKYVSQSIEFIDIPGFFLFPLPKIGKPIVNFFKGFAF